MKLKLYNLLESTKVLGPFNRFALWTQGCPFSCLGCMTPDSQPLEGGVEYDLRELEQLILKQKDIEGLTITGGEPFLQVEALVELIVSVCKKKNLGIVVYTGYTLKEITLDLNKQKLLKHVDILIDGQYINELNDGIGLRGSFNQNVYQLTDRYRDVFHDYYNKKQRDIEVYLNKEEFIIAGIPKQERLEQFKKKGLIL